MPCIRWICISEGLRVEFSEWVLALAGLLLRCRNNAHSSLVLNRWWRQGICRSLRMLWEHCWWCRIICWCGSCGWWCVFSISPAWMSFASPPTKFGTLYCLLGHRFMLRKTNVVTPLIRYHLYQEVNNFKLYYEESDPVCTLSLLPEIN